MLAPSARCFAESAGIERAQVDEERSEYAMTNKGLGISLLVWVLTKDWESNVKYRAPLNCKSKHDGVALAVALDRLGEETYLRRNPSELVPWGPEYTQSSSWTRMPRRKLYIPQVRTYSDSPQQSSQRWCDLTFHAPIGMSIKTLHEYRWRAEQKITGVNNLTHSLVRYRVETLSEVQLLVVLETVHAELVLCISPFNNFLALSIFARQDFMDLPGILEAAQAKLHRATDTVSLYLPGQEDTVTARLKPKPTNYALGRPRKRRPVDVELAWTRRYGDGELA